MLCLGGEVFDDGVQDLGTIFNSGIVTIKHPKWGTKIQAYNHDFDS